MLTNSNTTSFSDEAYERTQTIIDQMIESSAEQIGLLEIVAAANDDGVIPFDPDFAKDLQDLYIAANRLIHQQKSLLDHRMLMSEVADMAKNAIAENRSPRRGKKSNSASMAS